MFLLSEGLLPDMHRSQYMALAFEERKKLYWEVDQQGDREQGSNLPPRWRVWGGKGLGEDGLAPGSTGRAGFSWRASAPDLSGHQTLWF